jgi:hypothetical protein
MNKAGNIKPIGRALGVALAVLVIISGVTFAMLQSQQVKITGSTIQTKTADLAISTDGQSYSSSISGFSFADILPGGSAVPANGYVFMLKNTGDTPLALKLAVSSTPSNPDDIDLSKVSVMMTPAVGAAQTYSLQALIDADATGGLSFPAPTQLSPNISNSYQIQVSMAGDAFTGSSAALGNIDFAFTGVAEAN